MKFVAILACILVGTAMSLAGDQPASKWKEFKSAEGRFKVLLPTDPKTFSQDSESEFGKTVLHFHVCEVDGVTYLTNYADAPEAAKKQKVDTLLDACRDGGVRNSGGKLVSEKKIKLGDHPGRELTIAPDNEMVFRSRVYLVNWRLYQLVVVGPKDKVGSKDVTAYFESFQLLKKE